MPFKRLTLITPPSFFQSGIHDNHHSDNKMDVRQCSSTKASSGSESAGVSNFQPFGALWNGIVANIMHPTQPRWWCNRSTYCKLQARGSAESFAMGAGDDLGVTEESPPPGYRRSRFSRAWLSLRQTLHGIHLRRQYRNNTVYTIVHPHM